MRVEDINPTDDNDQLECPSCGQPLNLDLRPVNISDSDKEPRKDKMGIIALCCGAELECGAETFIDLLPGQD